MSGCMHRRHLQGLLIAINAGLLAPPPVFAHHEAIFGSQSSAILSPGTFVSAQIFDRENGRGDDKHRETITVFSAGVRPVKKMPLSVAVVVPITFASALGGPSSHGLEDALVSARYRFEADRLAASLGLEEGYAMGVGGLEIPTGTLDHAFGRGPVGEIAAGLVSLEKRPFAAIAYVYYHHAGVYDGERSSGNVFAGTGVAWTPIDDDASGKLFSLQLGLSHERTFAAEHDGIALTDSGGSGIFLHQASWCPPRPACSSLDWSRCRCRSSGGRPPTVNGFGSAAAPL